MSLAGSKGLQLVGSRTVDNE